MLIKFYPLENSERLENYFKVYLPLVIDCANAFSINLTNKNFSGDHLGIQVLDTSEFDQSSNLLSKFASLTKDSVIHDRRNRVFLLNNPLKYKEIIIPKIEIFEPKPLADLTKLKPGIEHIAFKVLNFDIFLTQCEKNNVPIDKKVIINNSNLFKTKLVNLVEIEFRNDSL